MKRSIFYHLSVEILATRCFYVHKLLELCHLQVSSTINSSGRGEYSQQFLGPGAEKRIFSHKHFLLSSKNTQSQCLASKPAFIPPR